MIFAAFFMIPISTRQQKSGTDDEISPVGPQPSS